jgi:uncharacterized membrane protein
MDETTGTPEPQSAPPTAPATAGGRPGPASDTSKILAAIGYIFWIVAIVAILIDPYKEEQFIKFHAVQALALGVLSMISWMIPIIGWIVGIVIFVFQIIGAIKAFGGNYYQMPVVYGLVKGFMGE